MNDETLLEANSVAVLSDTHLAAGNCVLDLKHEDGMGGLTRFLQENRIDVDVFILMGDIFDLALATYAETVPRVQRLVEVLANHCRRIVYVPGNHDHHMWLLANEGNEIAQPFPKCPKDFPPRTERSYEDSFLSKISSKVPFSVSYPNVYFRPRKGGGRTFVFHHGHFCEDTYTLVSDIYRAGFDGVISSLDGLESLNAGWVEMVWYHLGQSGVGIGAGGFVESLYNQIREGDTRKLEEGIRQLYATKVGPIVYTWLMELSNHHWYIAKWMAEWATKIANRVVPNLICGAIKRSVVSHVEDTSLGGSALRGAALDEMLAASCRKYLKLTAASRVDLADGKLSLIFGHTHRFGVWPTAHPTIFNDGGWITDDPDKDWPDAFVFVVDDAATVRALQFGKDGATLNTFEYSQ